MGASCGSRSRPTTRTRRSAMAPIGAQSLPFSVQADRFRPTTNEAFVLRPRQSIGYDQLRSRPASHTVRDPNKNSLRRNAAMTDSPLRAKGRAMRRNLMGAAYADKLDRQLYTDPIMEKFAELTQETIFGSLWTRPGLDLKTRTLICVISDTATGRTPELKLHIRFALNHGWTEDELSEAILHLLGYVGAPLVREALLVAKETFAEIRAETPVKS